MACTPSDAAAGTRTDDAARLIQLQRYIAQAWAIDPERVPGIREEIEAILRRMTERSREPDPEAQRREQEAFFARQAIEIERLHRAAGLPPLHAQRAAGPLEDQGEWGELLERLRRHGEPGLPGATVAVVGRRGAGKTQLAACLVLHFVQGLRTARYELAEDVFDALHDARRTDRPVRPIVEDLSVPELLVVDEIDKRAETDFEARMLMRIVDARYGAGRTTLLVGCYDPDGFREAMGPSIVSRMDERGEIVELAGESFRRRA